MKKRIALLPGDGIGPEVAESAADVLKSVAEQFGHEFEFENGLIGEQPLTLIKIPSLRRLLLFVKDPTPFCSVQSADRNGTKILLSSGRKKACSASEKNSACLPICVP